MGGRHYQIEKGWRDARVLSLHSNELATLLFGGAAHGEGKPRGDAPAAN